MSAFSHTVLITGGTSGLGYECALRIAKLHPEYQILIASRSDPNPSTAISINTKLSQSNVRYLALDLSSPSSIRAFASTFTTSAYPSITALLLNAGLQFPGPLTTTPSGIESTFAVNHLGHAHLFFLLRPHLSPNARIVVTASGVHDPAQHTGMPDAHYPGAAELARPAEQASIAADGRQRYSASKLCNVLWSYALHRRLVRSHAAANEHSATAQTQIQTQTVTAFDPGLMPGTGLARAAPWPLRFVFVHVLPWLIPLLRLLLLANTHSAGESGAALARLAVGDDDGVKDVSGKYFEGLKEIKSSEESYDVAKQEELWNWTVGELGSDAQGWP